MRTFVRTILPLACLMVVAGPASADGLDTTALECGIFRDYTAPDAGTATPGSITFGITASPEVIAADATLVPPADSSLPSLQGGAPTALNVTRDGGVITAGDVFRSAVGPRPHSLAGSVARHGDCDDRSVTASNDEVGGSIPARSPRTAR